MLKALKFLLALYNQVLRAARQEAPNYPSTEARFEFFICFTIPQKELLEVRMDCGLFVLLKLRGPVLNRKLRMILASLVRHESM